MPTEFKIHEAIPHRMEKRKTSTADHRETRAQTAQGGGGAALAGSLALVSTCPPFSKAAAEYIPFLRVCEIFTQIENMLYHKTSLNIKV